MTERMCTSCGSVPIYNKMHRWCSGEKNNFFRLVILRLHICLGQAGLNSYLISPLFNFLNCIITCSCCQRHICKRWILTGSTIPCRRHRLQIHLAHHDIDCICSKQILLDHFPFLPYPFHVSRFREQTGLSTPTTQAGSELSSISFAAFIISPLIVFSFSPYSISILSTGNPHLSFLVSSR